MEFTQVTSFTGIVQPKPNMYTSNHMPSKVWYEITYPIPNFNSGTIIYSDYGICKLSANGDDKHASDTVANTHTRIYMMPYIIYPLLDLNPFFVAYWNRSVI